MDGTWETAFKKAVQKYFDEGDEDMAINKVKPMKYNKKYLDAFEQERLGTKKAKEKAVPSANDK